MRHLIGAAAIGILGLTAPVAQAFDIDSMNAAERDQFRAEIRAYLLDNPEVIIEAIDVLEARQAAQQDQNDKTLVQVNADDLFNDGFSFVGGNPDGDITLVEFVDYRCGYCRRAHDEVKELVASDGNIRFIVKEFPILGEASLLSSRFAIATKQVAGDEAYVAVNDALIRLNGDLNDTTLTRLASSLGLDGDAIIAQMGSDDVTAEIRKTRELAQRLQISGTPTFVMHDEMLRGYLPLDNMRQLVGQIRG